MVLVCEDRPHLNARLLQTRGEEVAHREATEVAEDTVGEAAMVPTEGRHQDAVDMDRLGEEGMVHRVVGEDMGRHQEDTADR